MKPNPLNFFGIREVKYQAPHFEYVDIEQSYNLEDVMRKWIEHNLKGRYHIGKTMIEYLSNSVPLLFQAAEGAPSEPGAPGTGSVHGHLQKCMFPNVYFFRGSGGLLPLTLANKTSLRMMSGKRFRRSVSPVTVCKKGPSEAVK